jgi:Tol biopolymer transport system component
LGKNDIYISRFVNGKWTEPQNLGAPINSEYNDANASLSADGKRLFFVSDRPGGQGGYDIWVSELGADGKWGEPKNLGEPVNTPDWEGAVFIAPDGLTLYFSSNGHEGYGGADIFRSNYQNGRWSQPQNLGDKINTEGNDTYFTIPGAGDVAYFSSTREGGKGKNDIIALPMPYVFEPKKIVVVVGKVVKQDTGEPVKAWIKVKYRPTRRDLAVIDTRENGSFRISFFPQKELVLMIYADPSEGEGFNPWYEPLELDIAKDNQVIVRNIAMAPGKKAVLIEKTEEGTSPQ